MHRVSVLALAALIFFAVFAQAMSRPAAAQSPDREAEAEALVKQGNDLRRSGDDQGALPLMQKAFSLVPNPRRAVQLGLTELALGLWAEADHHLTFGLKAAKDPWIAENRATIAQSLREAKRHVGRVQIAGDPAGAEVLINGQMVGRLPLKQAITVAEGSVDVEVRAPGYRRAFRSVPIAGGQYQRLVIRLEQTSEDPAPSAPATEALVGRGLLQAEQPRKPWRRMATYAVAGGAIVGAGLGVYGWLRHDSQVRAFNGQGCVDGESGPVRRPDIADPRCRDLHASYKSARTISAVGFVAAAALATTAVVLFLTEAGTPSDPRANEVQAFYCAPDMSHRGLACVARF